MFADTLLTNTPRGLERAGLKPEDVQPALRSIVDTVTDRGPGGHILTGPVYVEGAEPGDALEVPGVATGRVGRRFADVERTELGRHGLAEDDEPGAPDPCHDLVVAIGPG